MDIVQAAKTRHATKAFDPERKLPAGLLAQLTALLRHSPSSLNTQPWHFIVASTEEGKARIAKATVAAYAYNEPKVRNAAAVIVLCSRSDIEPAHLTAVLDQEERDGRFRTASAKANQHQGRGDYINLHRHALKDQQHWLDKQVYLALGALLLGAAALEVDTCPMEGFDTRILDQEFDLNARGLGSLVLVAIGYHGKDDFNAGLAKSRLPEESVMTFI